MTTHSTEQNIMPDSHIDGEFDEELNTSAKNTVNLTHRVTDDEVGFRLDKLASMVFEDFSRVQLQGFIEDGTLTVNGAAQKPKYRVKLNDEIHLCAVIENHSEDLPENIDINIIYEDDDVVVINKPAGMVVHPGAGNRTGTLVNALLYHYPDSAHLPRAGLVHRIDKETTGLLVVARTKAAQMNLIEQLKDKSVYRHYQCICQGVPSDILRHSVIDLPIARHPTQRTKMAVRDGGRNAVTYIMKATPIHERYSLLDVRLETGRTHQIRVHLSHLGFALVGDPVYGAPIKSGLDRIHLEALKSFNRQALHAYKLGFIHPVTSEEMAFHAPLPDDMQALIDVISEDWDGR